MIDRKCRFCSRIFYLNVTQAQLDAWQGGGQLIQDAMPNLNAGQRELLMSGYCGDCFDRLFAEDDDSEDDDSEEDDG